jgi:hypothetical protein
LILVKNSFDTNVCIINVYINIYIYIRISKFFSKYDKNVSEGFVKFLSLMLSLLHVNLYLFHIF